MSIIEREKIPDVTRIEARLVDKVLGLWEIGMRYSDGTSEITEGYYPEGLTEADFRPAYPHVEIIIFTNGYDLI